MTASFAPRRLGREMPDGSDGEVAWVLLTLDTSEVVQYEWEGDRWRDWDGAVLHPGDTVQGAAIFAGIDEAMMWMTHTLRGLPL